MPSGVIGISTAETGRWSSFYASLYGLQKPPKHEITTCFSAGAEIAKNRNKITETFLEKQADWVLYLDDDHILPPYALLNLLAADKDVISAHYTQRMAPFNPILMEAEVEGGFIQKRLSPSERGIIKVAASGAGCMLVKRKVIEALTPPYWTMGQLNPGSWGDDLHFCSRVSKAGFDIYCDLDMTIGHVMSGVVWPSFNEKQGWVANFGQDPQKAPLVGFLMPMPGDPSGS